MADTQNLPSPLYEGNLFPFSFLQSFFWGVGGALPNDFLLKIGYMCKRQKFKQYKKEIY